MDEELCLVDLYLLQGSAGIELAGCLCGEEVTATLHMSSRGLDKDVRRRILNQKVLSVNAIYDR